MTSSKQLRSGEPQPYCPLCRSESRESRKQVRALDWMPMEECRHPWHNEPAAEQSEVSANFIAEVRDPEPYPSCHVCGAGMVPNGYRCPSCGANTKPGEAQGGGSQSLERKCEHKHLNFGVLGCKECEEFAGRRAWTWLINKDYLPAEAAQPMSEPNEIEVAYQKWVHELKNRPTWRDAFFDGWQAARAGMPDVNEILLAVEQYRHSIDHIYNDGEKGRELVVKYFGTTHPRINRATSLRPETGEKE